jgi:small subunit ribosomal protein S8
MHDPIADMLTRIRNGQIANHKAVDIPASKIKLGIAKVLLDEGYIASCEEIDAANNKKHIRIELKYYRGRPVIERIRRISRPGIRKYLPCNKLQPVAGFGIAILTTSKGIMSHLAAKQLGIGGEIICEVA